MKILIVFFPIFVFSSTINIAVASNVFLAIKELKKQFLSTNTNTNTNTKINITVSSSGKLTAQIKNHAPYHIFMSADMKYPNELYKNSLTITKPKIYARGKLAILSHKDISNKKVIDIIKNANKIAIANPLIAPYGKAAIQTIKNIGLYKQVKPKLIYAESISQVVFYTKIATDIGFVALSSLFNPNIKHLQENKHWLKVDENLYTPLEQGIVLLRDNKTAIEFYNFILSDKSKQTFIDFGYQTK